MLNDIVWLMGYLLTEFFNYSIVYYVIFRVSISRSVKKWFLSIGIIYCVHFILLKLMGKEATSALTLFTMIVIPFLILEPVERKNFLLYPFVVIGTSVIAMSVSFLLAVILKIPEHIIAKGNWYTVFCQVIQSILLIVLYGYRKIKKKEDYCVHLDWKQYVLFYIVVVCLFFLLAPIQELTKRYGEDPYINMSGLFTSIACIALVIVTIWQGITVNHKITLMERNKRNEEYINLQREYYENLLEQDEKMRRFRHDLKAHITVMKEHCRNGDYKELEDYLSCIVEESSILPVESYTGNKGVDAVLRQLFIKAKKQQINVKMKGYLPEEFRISEYDFCTIMSNLVKNAIEACEKIEEISERSIIIQIGPYNKQIFISVKNMIAGNAKFRDKQLVTTKENHKYHGLGSGNVENTVKKYNGDIEYHIEKNCFMVEIMI